MGNAQHWEDEDFPKCHFTLKICSRISNVSTDLLHITPAPNNGTHGSLNHLLKTPFYNPSHANEDSSPSSCPVSHLIPTDELGCTCTQVSRAVWGLLLVFVTCVLSAVSELWIHSEWFSYVLQISNVSEINARLNLTTEESKWQEMKRTAIF